MSKAEVKIIINSIEGKFIAYTALKDSYKKYNLQMEILKDIEEFKELIENIVK